MLSQTFSLLGRATICWQ